MIKYEKRGVWRVFHQLLSRIKLEASKVVLIHSHALEAADETKST